MRETIGILARGEESSIVEVLKTFDMDKQLKVEIHRILEVIKGFYEYKRRKNAYDSIDCR